MYMNIHTILFTMSTSKIIHIHTRFLLDPVLYSLQSIPLVLICLRTNVPQVITMRNTIFYTENHKKNNKSESRTGRGIIPPITAATLHHIPPLHHTLCVSVCVWKTRNRISTVWKVKCQLWLWFVPVLFSKNKRGEVLLFAQICDQNDSSFPFGVIVIPVFVILYFL